MGLFKKKVKNQTETNQSQENTGSVSADEILLRALISGDVITKDMALSLPVVSKAVAKISNTFAMVPFVLYKETKVDGKRQIENKRSERDGGNIYRCVYVPSVFSADIRKNYYR